MISNIVKVEEHLSYYYCIEYYRFEHYTILELENNR